MISMALCWLFPFFRTAGEITDRSFGQVGSFVPPRPSVVVLATGNAFATQGLSVGDLDNDGRPDLVVTQANNRSLLIFRSTHASGNLNTNSFVLAQVYSLPEGATETAVGDLNGDGKPDLAAATFSGESLYILENTSVSGVIRFEAPVTLRSGFSNGLGGLQVADLDGDGWGEITTGGVWALLVLRNQAVRGTLTRSSFSRVSEFPIDREGLQHVVLGDVDNDGKPDVAGVGSRGRVTLLRNSCTPGRISFDAPVFLAAPAAANGIAIGDLDGDGTNDLAVATHSNIFCLFKNTNPSGPGMLSADSFGRTDLPAWPAFENLLAVRIADLNGDRRLDLVLTDRSRRVHVVENIGGVEWAKAFSRITHLSIPAGDAASGLWPHPAIADLNADGKPDLILDAESGRVYLSQNFVGPLVAQKFTLSPVRNLELPWRNLATMTATLGMSDGSAIDVTQASQWSSSRPAVASVDASGRIVGLSEGTTTIAAQFESWSASSLVIVVPAVFGDAPGNPDLRFLPTISNARLFGSVEAIAIRPDGRLVIAGEFARVNGETVSRVAGLRADGTLDPAFHAGTGPNSRVNSVALQPDGKLIIGGDFTAVQGIERIAVARLSAEGLLDPSFVPALSAVGINSVLIQPDGKIVVGRGDYSNLPVLRLNPDGTRDTGFLVSNLSGGVDALALDQDGRLLIGGSFGYGSELFCLARLRPDGALDSSFARKIRSSRIHSLAVQPDGRIVVGGDFVAPGPGAPAFVARVEPNGELDASFQSVIGQPPGIVTAVALQRNGKIVVGRSGVGPIRLHPDGSLDAAFDRSWSWPGWSVQTIVIGEDDAILVGGGVASVNGTPILGLMKLRGDITRFLGWQNKHFSVAELADPEISGLAASLAGDGLPNLVKYAFDRAPRAWISEPLLSASFRTNTFALTFAPNTSASDLRFVVERSDSVNEDWFPAATRMPGAKSWIVHAPDISLMELISGTVVLHIRAAEAAGKGFLRLSIFHP